MMELKEAIEEAKKGIGNQCTHYHEECLSLVLSAAEKWCAQEWMHESGFADSYTFGYVMEHMQDFIDAYEKEHNG